MEFPLCSSCCRCHCILIPHFQLLRQLQEERSIFFFKYIVQQIYTSTYSPAQQSSVSSKPGPAQLSVSQYKEPKQSSSLSQSPSPSLQGVSFVQQLLSVPLHWNCSSSTIVPPWVYKLKRSLWNITFIKFWHSCIAYLHQCWISQPKKFIWRPVETFADNVNQSLSLILIAHAW